ncbi:interleukin-15 receptor subunit alpha isoform 1 precursor [Mus musculus]|uniref:Interleukin-15 receptor subunit alpha n=4 Tax=Mus musculus TaxID=10090 RepID=I15RA_MOUSE|nr:interleukin-15 receptor subunit alpha isoform 1 precursor [Mus musculus]Q60819.1 RecName: Full=Interleukin-15 receptor subunit alpha; Short=IL-15 receptor subunit alpha; Short=IL-15R-alpha; Short=IL-15RA; AltName: CD_antigen=CD215; Contains: RecName: Full=Soluble interleukin-15 receptor subunit alpha; Short=sIL-15 receptor subunit alpha; Short=sIL-15R-alpha; Short=sIL-15RA; Flags: Precursor [Mus musculus]AAC52240.1 interleukin 15 receptor precursor [Mus musculus]EDL08029.1 interleukin 15 rece|eukprot:NP_032384.1 interleukin-15 receptor subunit alpha isoform 1 precursor [Mus musculus]
MASPQLRGYGVQAIPVLLLLLLLLLLPLRVTPGTTCPPPVSIEHADIRVKNYSVNSRERYVCNSGFKRKAGTSTLIECVINKNTNVAHWTTPSLKCIRDPSLAHYSPVPTVVTPKVTSQPESPSPSAKEPEAFSPKSDTAMTTETAIMPGSRLTPSQTTSAGTTGTGSHKSSRAPSLAATMTLEPTASTSLRITEISPHSSKMTKVAISTSVLLVGAGVVMAFLAWYIKSRQPSQPCRVEVETMETVPMTVRASSKEDEDTGA